jgi:hypothetical protein
MKMPRNCAAFFCLRVVRTDLTIAREVSLGRVDTLVVFYTLERAVTKGCTFGQCIAKQ